jgi:ankyrin repeat protein
MQDLLSWAAMYGDLERLRSLLAVGLSPKTPDGRGRTALHYAARGGHTQALALLLRAGADPDAKDSRGRTALELARRAGQTKATAFLRGHIALRNAGGLVVAA